MQGPSLMALHGKRKDASKRNAAHLMFLASLPLTKVPSRSALHCAVYPFADEDSLDTNALNLSIHPHHIPLTGLRAATTTLNTLHNLVHRMRICASCSLHRITSHNIVFLFFVCFVILTRWFDNPADNFFFGLMWYRREATPSRTHSRLPCIYSCIYRIYNNDVHSIIIMDNCIAVLVLAQHFGCKDRKHDAISRPFLVYPRLFI
jgi:hypothetical protein